MSTIARGTRGRMVSVAAITLAAGLTLGLSGCQTPRAGTVLPVDQGSVPAAVDVERANRAAQERLEGLAELYAARERAAARANSPVTPMTADRMDRAAAGQQATTPKPPVVADRMDRAADGDDAEAPGPLVVPDPLIAR